MVRFSISSSPSPSLPHFASSPPYIVLLRKHRACLPSFLAYFHSKFPTCRPVFSFLATSLSPFVSLPNFLPVPVSQYLRKLSDFDIPLSAWSDQVCAKRFARYYFRLISTLARKAYFVSASNYPARFVHWLQYLHTGSILEYLFGICKSDQKIGRWSFYSLVEGPFQEADTLWAWTLPFNGFPNKAIYTAIRHEICSNMFYFLRFGRKFLGEIEGACLIENRALSAKLPPLTSGVDEFERFISNTLVLAERALALYIRTRVSALVSCRLHFVVELKICLWLV